MQALGNNTDNIYVLLLLGMAGMFLLASGVLLFYIRSQKRIRQEQEERQARQLRHQKELTYAVIQSQEAERRRIGQELHDDVGSALSNLKLYTDKAFGEKVDNIIGKVRSLSHLLSPATLEMFGLEESVEELCLLVHQSGAVRVIFDNQAPVELRGMDYEPALSLYRVLQELFTNTLRHAAATEVILGFLKEDGGVVCTYADNGKGLSTSAKGGMGMQNIESRLGMIGATYRLQEAGRKGFGIRIYVPV
jgi:signal transduction histidine kinase